MNSVTLAEATSINEQLNNSPDSQIVVSVTHWTDTLFSFRLTRSDQFRFRSGEFVMIGLPDDQGKILLRAYSIASPCWDEELEFYSIKVPDGPLTSRLQRIVPGDRVIVKSKPVGTLVVDALLPGNNLWLLATGTGVAPFASLIRDPDVYDRYENIILVHTCRYQAQLAYGQSIVDSARVDPLVGDDVQEKLVYYPTTTVEPSKTMGRVTRLIEQKQLFTDLSRQPWNRDHDRVMICGSIAMNKDLMQICKAFDLSEGSNNSPGHFVVEKAFVD